MRLTSEMDVRSRSAAAASERRWGREVVHGAVGGHPCLLFADRPRQAGTLLQDARRWGPREYLVQGPLRISFSRHEDAVLRLAATLAQRGVRAGERVALAGADGPLWVVGLWAVLVAGAVAVPCDPRWSAAQVADALVATDARLVIGAKLPGRPQLPFEEVAALVEGFDRPRWPAQAWDEESPAIIVFTAGTTAAPKGATLSHRAVIAGVQNLLASRGLLPPDLGPRYVPPVSLMTLPLFHVGGITTLVANLLCGGRCVFLDGRFDAEEAIRLIERERVTSWGAIPTMVRRVVESPLARTSDLRSVRSLTMGGAPVPDELVRRARETFPSNRLGAANTYGLTEAGGHVATARGTEPRARPGSSGRALPTVEIRIATSPDAPPGAGEILVRSPANMSGYWGVGAAGVIDDDGWLHTGDIGSLDADGQLLVIDRQKDIVIRGGENVAAPSVERALLEHPAVREAAVIGLPHADLGEEVAAAVVAAPGRTVSPQELRAFLRERLAYYEVPSAWWIRTDPLPVTDVGKVRKRQLRAEWPDRAMPSDG